MKEPSFPLVRETRPDDFPAVIEICREVYPATPPWGETQLDSHLRVFPEGQFVAEINGQVVGMAASLIVMWDEYEVQDNWRDMTDYGMFTNHDPAGRTLYGAEVMVRPAAQGRGVGKALYAARRELVERLGLLRIRAGARLRDYHKHASEMSAQDYVRKVTRGELVDRTLTFQLRRGFRVAAVVESYLRNDPESLGYAAVIEWINEKVAKAEERAGATHAYGRYE